MQLLSSCCGSYSTCYLPLPPAQATPPCPTANVLDLHVSIILCQRTSRSIFCLLFPRNLECCKNPSACEVERESRRPNPSVEECTKSNWATGCRKPCFNNILEDIHLSCICSCQVPDSISASSGLYGRWAAIWGCRQRDKIWFAAKFQSIG